MSDADRLRRPVPERKGPKRNVLGALGQSDPLLRPDGYPNASGGSPGNGMHPLGPGFGTTDDAMVGDGLSTADEREFIDRGVRDASDLVDAHIRQGEETARSLGGGSTPGAGNPLSQTDLSALLTGLMRTYSDVAAVWVDLVSSLAQNREGAPQKTAGPAPETGFASNIGLSITCDGRVETGFELFRIAGEVVPQPLVSTGGSVTSQINGVRYEAGQPNSTGRICVKVPKGQAPGTYHGLLLSASDHTPVGVLTLRVFDSGADDESGEQS